jgi:hypothetical protein
MSISKIIQYLLCVLFFNLNALGQEIKVSLSQDPRFEQLLNEKRKMNTYLIRNDSYKIQIYSGNADNAKKTLNECRLEFSHLDATMIFNTPNYKVCIGNFKTRIEAEKNLITIRNTYKNALLIKPLK